MSKFLLNGPMGFPEIEADTLQGAIRLCSKFYSGIHCEPKDKTFYYDVEVYEIVYRKTIYFSEGGSMRKSLPAGCRVAGGK